MGKRIGKADHGVDQDHKIGSVGVVGQKFSCCGSCEVSTCGEAHDANLLGIELVIGGLGSYQPDSLEGILEGSEGGIGLELGVGQAVLQHKNSDAILEQALCHAGTFLLEGGSHVATSRANHDRFAVGYGRAVHGKGGVGRIEISQSVCGTSLFGFTLVQAASVPGDCPGIEGNYGLGKEGEAGTEQTQKQAGKFHGIDFCRV